MTWRLRWYLAIAITIVYALSLMAGLLGFGITKDLHYLWFIAPTVLIPLVRLLVPMDRKKHELEMAKIHANRELAELRLRVQMLEAELNKHQANGSTFAAVKSGRPPRSIPS
jgi:hypothetical protein